MNQIEPIDCQALQADVVREFKAELMLHYGPRGPVRDEYDRWLLGKLAEQEVRLRALEKNQAPDFEGAEKEFRNV